MIDTLHHLLVEIAEYGVLAFEFIGLALLVWAGIKGLICLAKKDHHVGLVLGEGVALALQFMICAEILKLITIHGMEDLIKVSACIILHVFLTLLVAYENNHHKAEHHGGH